MPTFRTIITVLFCDRTRCGKPSHYLVDVEDSAPGAPLRRYQLPTRYRSRASATRAARDLALSMGATIDTREPWC